MVVFFLQVKLPLFNIIISNNITIFIDTYNTIYRFPRHYDTLWLEINIVALGKVGTLYVQFSVYTYYGHNEF